MAACCPTNEIPRLLIALLPYLLAKLYGYYKGNDITSMGKVVSIMLLLLFFAASVNPNIMVGLQISLTP